MRACAVDTNIFVKALKGHEPTIKWLQQLEDSGTKIFVSTFVVMELIAGCTNTEELNRIEALVAKFKLYEPTDGDCERALDLVRKNYRPGFKLDVLDALIASCAIALHVRLFTYDNDLLHPHLRDFKSERPQEPLL